MKRYVINIIIYMSVSVIPHANRFFYITPLYNGICNLSVFTIFFPHYLTNGTIFGKELLNMKRLF
jgi:hypothetical protein